MKMPSVADRVRQRQFRLAIICASVFAVAAVLLAFGQLLAALLVVIVGALLLEIEQRNMRARTLARQLVAGQALEKLEVPQGAWGELCRAINTLVQEQRIHERTHAVAPRAESGLRSSSSQRTAAVLLVSCANTQPRRYGPQPSVSNWQALARATQHMAQAHGALLQPCGDAIMLVFGAWSDLPLERSLLSAVTAAESLGTAWHGHQRVPLAMSLTSGVVAVTSLPGLGCCVLGTPVEQAVQIERLALASPYYRLLCDESAFYALRHHGSIEWRPTEFRIQSSDGRPHIVYGSSAG